MSPPAPPTLPAPAAPPALSAPLALPAPAAPPALPAHAAPPAWSSVSRQGRRSRWGHGATLPMCLLFSAVSLVGRFMILRLSWMIMRTYAMVEDIVRTVVLAASKILMIISTMFWETLKLSRKCIRRCYSKFYDPGR